VIVAQGSSSSLSSSLCLAQICASRQRRAFSCAQRHIPSPEALRTGRQSPPGKTNTNLRKIEAENKRQTTMTRGAY
jgi:hypothetical protein